MNRVSSHSPLSTPTVRLGSSIVQLCSESLVRFLDLAQRELGRGLEVERVVVCDKLFKLVIKVL